MIATTIDDIMELARINRRLGWNGNDDATIKPEETLPYLLFEKNLYYSIRAEEENMTDFREKLLKEMSEFLDKDTNRYDVVTGWLERNIRRKTESMTKIHDYNPDIIFLTLTSAAPYGWVIKEMYKTAWPDELPKIYTINVKGVRYQFANGNDKDDERPEFDAEKARKLPEFEEVVENVKSKLRHVPDFKRILIVDEACLGATLQIAQDSIKEAAYRSGVQADVECCLFSRGTSSIEGNPWEAKYHGNIRNIKSYQEATDVGFVRKKEKIRKAKNVIKRNKELGRRLGQLMKELKGSE